MALTPEQIGAVSDIIMMPYAATALLVSALNATEIALTESDITEFAKFKNKFTPVQQVGSIKLGVNPETSRLAIRNRVRIRLGLLSLESETDGYGTAGTGTIEYSNPSGCCDFECDEC
jgi:hypothetical protein